MKKLISILLALAMVMSLAVGIVAAEEPSIQITAPIHVYGTETITTGDEWFDGYNWKNAQIFAKIDGQEISGGVFEHLTELGYTVTCTDDQAPDNLWTIPEGQLSAAYKGHVVIADSTGATVLDTDVDVHILTPGNNVTSITLDDDTITYYAVEGYRGNHHVMGTVKLACGCSRHEEFYFSNEWDWPTEAGTYEKTISVGNSGFELPVTVVVEPKAEGYAFDMCYYKDGYGAVASEYQLSVSFGGDGSRDWYERYDISYGDPIVKEWPTEVGTHTVTFEKKVTVNGQEYTFEIPLNIIVQELPALSGKCGDNMTWSLDIETGILTISGTGDMYTVVDGLEWVDEILWEPGWWRNNCVRHIVIEDGVERLSDFAFRYNLAVESIRLPATLKEFPDLGLFVSEYAIEKLVIPEGVTSITGWPFGSPGNSFMSIQELYLPSTLTEIDLVSLALGCIQAVEDGFSFEGLTVHYAGTQEQWEAIQRVKSDFFAEQGLEEFYNSFTENLPSFEAAVVFEPKFTVENGTATIPDSRVEIEEGKDVVIDVTTTETEETVTGAVIGSETVDKLADAGTKVEIKLPDATVSFDTAAMGTIAGAAENTAITVVAKEVEETALTTEQKTALADLEVSAVLTLEVLAGDAKISDFGGGKATIAVPFELPEGKNGNDYYVAYIADDGTITAMPTTYADGALTFTTTHFSEYAVLEKAPVSDTPNTGDGSSPMLWLVLLTVSAAAMTACITKRKLY